MKKSTVSKVGKLFIFNEEIGTKDNFQEFLDENDAADSRCLRTGLILFITLVAIIIASVALLQETPVTKTEVFCLTFFSFLFGFTPPVWVREVSRDKEKTYKAEKWRGIMKELRASPYFRQVAAMVDDPNVKQSIAFKDLDRIYRQTIAFSGDSFYEKRKGYPTF